MVGDLTDIGSRKVAHVMDLIGQPAFLIDVDGPGQFRFSHINSQHAQESGVDAAQLLGKTPHDVLPTRLADTVVDNYERCRSRARVETYEEQLELASQTRWWRTTLSPIGAAGPGGGVDQILGTAVDITDMKTRDIDLTKALSAQVTACNDIRAFASNAMLDTQGPMRAILAWLDILRDGFVDLGDGKLDEMDRVQQLAIDAIVGMDDVLHSEGFLQQGPAARSVVKLDHMCRDIAALVDPNHRINMQLPAQVLEGDWAVIQIVLRSFIEQAAKRAIKSVSVQVDQVAMGMVTFTIKDDGAYEKSSKSRMIETAPAASLVKERGGKVSITPNPEEGTIVHVALPGQVLEAGLDGQNSPREARRVNA